MIEKIFIHRPMSNTDIVTFSSMVEAIQAVNSSKEELFAKQHLLKEGKWMVRSFERGSERALM